MYIYNMVTQRMHDAHKHFLDVILSRIKPKSDELVNINDSLGRIVSSDIRAKHAFPAKDTVSVDGYAIICGDSSNAPINLKIIAKSTAGCPFMGKVEHFQAVRTYAGSPLPKGADTVIPDDECTVKDGSITVIKPFLNQQNMLFSGADFVASELIIKKGTKITPIEIVLVASMNMFYLEVHETPRIGILAIGDELIELGKHADADKTISTSGIILQAFLKSLGVTTIDLGVVTDNELAISKKLDDISDMDMIITTGGLSGASDGLLKKALGKNKATTNIIQLNLNAKASVMISQKNYIPVLSLPGQPISAYMCAALLLKPIIYHMGHRTLNHIHENAALLDRDLDVNDLQMDYIFSRLVINEDKALKVIPASSYDRMIMSTLTGSDCVMQVDKNNCHKGDAVNIYKFRD